MAAVPSLPEEPATKEGPTMMWGWQAWSWWGWLAMSVGMIAFWGLVIWAIAAIFRGSDWTWRHPERPTPEQILAERFAASEIDEDEYQRRLETLRSAGQHTRERQR